MELASIWDYQNRRCNARSARIRTHLGQNPTLVLISLIPLLYLTLSNIFVLSGGLCIGLWDLFYFILFACLCGLCPGCGRLVIFVLSGGLCIGLKPLFLYFRGGAVRFSFFLVPFWLHVLFLVFCWALPFW